MSSIPYINPLSPVQIGGTTSVPRDVNYGVAYSTNLVGGYMEVESLSNLNYTIPSGTSGLTQFSGNSIPISFVKGNGSGYSPDVLFLNNDNISSGRRKIGMLVFVREQNQIYQYNIDGYETLWNSATAATGTVQISYLGTTVNNTSVAGQNFINAWTASTIDGVGGYTMSNAKWKKYYGNTISVTGASFNSGTGTLTLTNITGGTQTLTGFGSGGGGGDSITGGTFNINNGNLNLNSTGGTITIGGLLYGTGTTNTIPKFLTPSGFTNSLLQDNGTTVSVGSPSSTSAILEIGSTSQGVLFPRMTQSQRLSISSPTPGLIVYQTDTPDGLYIYKVGGWTQII
jgi:hypothetical protein